MNKLDQIFDGPEHISQTNVPWETVVRDDFHVIVYLDKYPVTEGHLLFVPKYNAIGVLNDAFKDAIEHGKKGVESGAFDGYNIGINMGEAAGQTVHWPHIHFIPRRIGDVQDPVGGVRNTFPGKGNYKSPSYKAD